MLDSAIDTDLISTHVECDRIAHNRCIRFCISTHALTWSATRQPTPVSRHRSISTHALTWSTTTADNESRYTNKNFNSRTHVECDTADNESRYTNKNFNSRTHVECDRWRTRRKQTWGISTHALTWSATGRMITMANIYEFQLTWSATRHFTLSRRNK